MADKLEVAELVRDRKAKYCRYLDTKQFDLWQSLFDPAAHITFYALDDSVLLDDSIETLAGAVRQRFANIRTVHQIHNSEIEFKSDREIFAIWAMEDWHVYTPQGGNPSKTLHGYGHYYETWRLVANSWVISRLELRRLILDLS
jgi:hypothetical protein